MSAVIRSFTIYVLLVWVGHVAMAAEPLSSTDPPSTQSAGATPTTVPAVPARQLGPAAIIAWLDLRPVESVRRPSKYDDASLRVRGDQNAELLMLLAPDAGRTMIDRPTLFFHLSKRTDLRVISALTLRDSDIPAATWELFFHLSKPTDLRVISALTRRDSDMPAATWEIPAGVAAGFHALHMRPTDPPLVPGGTYEWAVSPVKGSKPRSNDLCRVAVLARVPNDAALADRLRHLHPIERVQPLGKAGLFFDATAEFMSATADEGGLPDAKEYRAALLDEMKRQQARATTDVKTRHR